MHDWKNISLWMDQLDEPLQPRAALPGDAKADVAIIGAGYTGLWTAYYLKQQAPQLRVTILEAETAGFGASGRNGGWVIGGLSGDTALLEKLPPEQRHDARTVLHDIPNEVGRVVAQEGIACDFRKGGVLYCAARYPEQEPRLRTWLQELRSQGYGEEDYRWLSPAELDEQMRVAQPYGALFFPHVATIQPAKLVRGLARSVERLGVIIHEQTRVLDWQAGRVRTERGTVRARWVVPAVEGYAGTLPELGRYQLPVQSLIIATEPLPADVWAQIGLSRGQAFSESSRQITYGQRSADDRMVFGARGGYQFGGRLRQDFRLTDEEIGLRRYLMGELFPALRDVAITHAWGGNLGVARRFRPHMLCDPQRGIAMAGGYGGEGVGASNLAGRTLADLILGNDTQLTRQPWVLHGQGPAALANWEPEPLRWLGYATIMRSFAAEDRVLADPASPRWVRRAASAFAGFMEGFMH